jgi:hypothetical protein
MESEICQYGLDCLEWSNEVCPKKYHLSPEDEYQMRMGESLDLSMVPCPDGDNCPRVWDEGCHYFHSIPEEIL